MSRKTYILLISLLICCIPLGAFSAVNSIGLQSSELQSSELQGYSFDPFAFVIQNDTGSTSDNEILKNEQLDFDHKTASEQKSYRRSYIFITLALTLPIIFFFWYKRMLYLILLAMILAAVSYEYQLESILVIEHVNKDKTLAKRQLNLIATKLQSNVQHNLSTIAGFAAYISATPDLSSNDFNRYANALMSKNPLSINFAAAKNLVVKYVYPLKGNEKVLGHDYEKSSHEIVMIKKVIKTKKILMIGPINLVQGGIAFIGRAPVFKSDNSYWGIISSPIRAERLFDDAGLNDDQNRIEVAIKSYNSFEAQGNIIFGDESLFDDNNGVSEKIDIGGMTWLLFATHKKINNNLPENILALRIYFAVGTAFLLLFVWNRFKQDVKRKRLESDLKNDYILLKAVGNVAKIGGWKMDRSYNYLNLSGQGPSLFEQWTGIKPQNMNDIKPLVSDVTFESMKLIIMAAFNSAEPFDVEYEIKSINKKPLWLRVISDGLVSKEDSSIMGTIQDVTDKVLSANLIEHQATYDSLTGLPNRLFYNDRLNKAIKVARRNNEKLAVLFVDLDRFKPINDNYGHIVGDQLLKEAAKRIKSSLRESDTVSRLSGDEFAIILNLIPQYNQVLRIAEQVLTRLKEPFHLEGNSVYLSASIGIALYPDDALTAEKLLSKADQAMYEVKANGRSGCQFYTKEMQLKSEYRHDLLNELIIAIQRNKLQSYYQPIIELQSGKITKCESLARWQKENGKFIPPIEFIGLAEESGLINKIDFIMLKEASNKLVKDNLLMKDNQTVNANQTVKDRQDIELSINISPRLFQTRDRALENWLELIKEMSQLLKITIEITERLLTEDSEKAFEVLNKIKSYGVKIAIDDFGTGYSSLNYLIKYPVDIIKIDRSFVKNIGIEPSSEALIETILAMANRLEIQVVAEGIETQEQLDYLKKNKCDFGQGYFLGKPMNKTNFSDFLNNSRNS